MNQQTSKLRGIFTSAWQIALGLIGAYIIYYWILWRGGKYLYEALVEPILTSPTTAPAGTPLLSNTWVDVLKLLWAVLGATLGAIAAAVVRRWYIFRALEGKINLLEMVRLKTLELTAGNSSIYSAEIAVLAGSIKYLFGEKEYINIGKYIEPNVALMILRTISALDALSMAAKSKDFEIELTRVSRPITQELQRFDLEKVRDSLEVLRFNSGGAASDAAEKTIG